MIGKNEGHQTPQPLNRRKFVKRIPLLGLSGLAPASLFGGTWASIDLPAPATDAVRLLLSRLDLESPALKAVKEVQDHPSVAEDRLLAYYHHRHSVKLPIDRKTKASMRGHCGTPEDMQIANDALKHVFIGQPAYPPHDCGKDINWHTNPYPDQEWVWQLNRMYFWASMARAYWNTGDEKYARAWCDQLTDWIRKNPRDGHHQYAWRSIEAGSRGASWIALFQRFVDASAFRPAILVAFLNSCYDHASFLMTIYHKKSNWALIEADGLAFIGFAFPEFRDAEKWRGEAISRLVQETHNQVYPDGFQRELSISYHVGCISWFQRTYALARDNGRQQAFPASYSRTIEKMCEIPMKLALPDGTNPQFGDSWEGKPGQYRGKFKQWADLFKREDFRFMATGGIQGKAPDDTAFALKESGFYSLRSGWDRDAICLVLKCGPDGGYHCQPDNGTFVLYAGGRHLMPDSGSYIYSGDPEGRAWFRQTKVHQTLTLDGRNSAYAPKLLRWNPGKNLDVLVVENESYPGLTHRRAVLFVEKQFFVIVDEAMGTATGNLDLHFQLAPGKMNVNDQTKAVGSTFESGWNVFIQAVEQPGLELEAEEGQVSFVYTKKQSRPALRYRLAKDTAEGRRFITVVIPYPARSAPGITTRLIGNPAIGALQVTLEVKAPTLGISRQLTYSL